MFLEVIVGEGSCGNSWYVCYRDTDGTMRIGHNNYSYSCNRAWLDIGMIVMKHTIEGRWLTQAIADNVSQDIMDAYLMQAVIRHAAPTTISCAIERERKRWYDKGVQDTRRELREMLGMRED